MSAMQSSFCSPRSLPCPGSPVIHGTLWCPWGWCIRLLILCWKRIHTMQLLLRPILSVSLQWCYVWCESVYLSPPWKSLSRSSGYLCPWRPPKPFVSCLWSRQFWLYDKVCILLLAMHWLANSFRAFDNIFYERNSIRSCERVTEIERIFGSLCWHAVKAFFYDAVCLLFT